MLIKVLQVNTNWSRAAIDLVEHMIRKQRLDAVLVAKPNKKMAKDKGWLLERRGDTSIKIVNKAIKVRKSGKEEGYTWLETENDLLMPVHATTY